MSCGPNPSWNEQVDACRPDSNDLALPELAGLAAAVDRDSALVAHLRKSQQVDQIIGLAVRQVPVPSGLQQRLLARLAASSAAEMLLREGSQEAVPSGGKSGVPSEAVIPYPVELGTRAAEASVSREWLPRRAALQRWVVCGGSLALVGLLCWLTGPGFRFHSQADVARQASVWLQRIDHTRWTGSGFPTRDFPWPAACRAVLYRWQPVADRAGVPPAVCFDLGPTRRPAHLFVCRVEGLVHLPGQPPAESRASLQGWQVGGWYDQGYVYVLAVRGEPLNYRETYRDLLRRPAVIAQRSLAAGPV